MRKLKRITMKRTEIIRKAEEIISKATLMRSDFDDITPDGWKNAALYRVRFEIDDGDMYFEVLCAAIAEIRMDKTKGTYDTPPDIRWSLDSVDMDMIEIYCDDFQIELTEEEKDRLENAVKLRISEEIGSL